MIDVHSDEERNIQEFIDEHLDRSGSNSRRSSGKNNAEGYIFLFRAFIWLCLQSIFAMFISGPAALVGVSLNHDELLSTASHMWVIAACAPIAALLAAWRADRWRRPLAIRRICIAAIVGMAISTAGTIYVLTDTQDSITKLTDPNEILFGITSLSTFTAMPVVIVHFFIARIVFARLKRRPIYK